MKEHTPKRNSINYVIIMTTTLTDEGNKISHERTHTKEKPYQLCNYYDNYFY